MAVLTPFLLWPLAALELTPRVLAHLAHTLTTRKAGSCPETCVRPSPAAS